MISAALAGAKHYLEYGSGDSTRLAARTPTLSSITSVESDPAFVSRELAGDPDIQSASQSGRLRFLMVDIGPTESWGHPLDRSKAHLWPNYALGPYLHGYLPDLVFIDGRFCVACGLVAALQAPEGTILIHDYPERPEYHVLEQFWKIEDRVAKLVKCRRQLQFDEAAARALLDIYLYCPADHKPEEPSGFAKFFAQFKPRRARHSRTQTDVATRVG